ncbi:MAG: HIT domain-containing protein, partial [Flavobacteriales bacterium]|nr:HIT domain-containing protein [Flavobacteriales bacterium]
MASIFTRIIRGEIPCHKLAEDDRYIAFLDVSPVHEGHALVVPKREVDHLFELEADELGGIMAFAKDVA